MGQTRLMEVQQQGRGLRQHHKVQRRGEALEELWEELSRSIRTRQEVEVHRGVHGGGAADPNPPPQVLGSARQFHQFQHDVDELRSWMAEKEALLGSEEDQDLHSIQSLLRQHQQLQVGRSLSPGDTPSRPQLLDTLLLMSTFRRTWS